MHLSPRQRLHPHRRFNYRSHSNRFTNLEQAFAGTHAPDRRFFWDNGVAEAALRHPKRGPNLIRAFLTGRSGGWRLPAEPPTPEERCTWERLWVPPLSSDPALAAQAWTCFALHAPDLADQLESLGVEAHRFVPNDSRYDQDPDAWVTLLKNLTHVLNRGWLPSYLTLDAIETLWQRLFRQWENRNHESGDPSLRLSHLDAGLHAIASLHHPQWLQPGGWADRFRQRFLEEGACPWKSQAFLTWMKQCKQAERSETGLLPVVHTEWTLGFLATNTDRTDPASIGREGRGGLESLAFLDRPDAVLKRLGELGIFPWQWKGATTPPLPCPNSIRESYSKPLIPKALTAWLGHLVALSQTAPPPPGDWVTDSAAIWMRFTRWRDFSTVPTEPSTGLAQEWAQQWAAWAHLGRWSERMDPKTASALMEAGLHRLNADHETADALVDALAKSGTLVPLLTSSPPGAPFLRNHLWGHWLASGSARQQKFVRHALQNTGAPLLRRRVWAELMQQERTGGLKSNGIEPEVRRALWLESDDPAQRLAALIETCKDGLLECFDALLPHVEPCSSPDLWEAWAKARVREEQDAVFGRGRAAAYLWDRLVETGWPVDEKPLAALVLRVGVLDGNAQLRVLDDARAQGVPFHASVLEVQPTHPEHRALQPMTQRWLGEQLLFQNVEPSPNRARRPRF